MVLAKNYETVSTFVEVMQRKLWPLHGVARPPNAVWVSRPMLRSWGLRQSWGLILRFYDKIGLRSARSWS